MPSTKTPNREEYLRVRMTAAALADLTKRARAAGMTLSEYVRHALALHKVG